MQKFSTENFIFRHCIQNIHNSFTVFKFSCQDTAFVQRLRFLKWRKSSFLLRIPPRSPKHTLAFVDSYNRTPAQHANSPYLVVCRGQKDTDGNRDRQRDRDPLENDDNDTLVSHKARDRSVGIGRTIGKTQGRCVTTGREEGRRARSSVDCKVRILGARTSRWGRINVASFLQSFRVKVDISISLTSVSSLSLSHRALSSCLIEASRSTIGIARQQETTVTSIKDGFPSSPRMMRSTLSRCSLLGDWCPRSRNGVLETFE